MENRFNVKMKSAGCASAVGAAFAGDLAVTTTSGPGVCLKSEAMNLAVIAELPLGRGQRTAWRPFDRYADQSRQQTDPSASPFTGRNR